MSSASTGTGTGFGIQLPGWFDEFLDRRTGPVHTDEQAMSLAIELARENVRRRCGGPFAALVTDPASGQLISAAVNLVVGSGLSLAHAEMVALSLAQQKVGDWNLAAHAPLTLITSCEPCAMCYGAVPWSGVTTVVCGASKADAERAGFDEGDKPEHWQAALEHRGIEVRTGVMAREAAELFAFYQQQGGEIYNAAPSGKSD